MYSRSVKCLLTLVLTLVFFNLAQAQSDSSINVTVTPSNYGPGETINVSLLSYSANLDGVQITWFLNGQTVASGIGRKSFSTTSGNIGTTSTLVVRIALPEGEVQKTIIIRPNTTILLWEAMDSHVPPFYRGKALPTRDSEIKVVAMPEIRSGVATLDPNTLIYTWRKDYSNEPEASGYGKKSFAYVNDFLESSNNVEVVISTVSGEQSATASVNISAAEPEILFYSKDLFLGILWERTIKDEYTVKNEETLLATPYFISPKDVHHPDLVFNWLINGLPVNVQSYKKNSIPLAVQPGTSGTSILRLEIENLNKIFQSVSKQVELQF